MRRLWEGRWEGKELADLCAPGSRVYGTPLMGRSCCGRDTVGQWRGRGGDAAGGGWDPRVPQWVPGATSPFNRDSPAKSVFEASLPISVCFPTLPWRRLLI